MFEIGDARIQKVHEMDLNGMTLEQLMPQMSEEDRTLLMPGHTTRRVTHS